MTKAVTIANPIYDSVFKHLMENIEVAQGLISALLGLEVTELIPSPQEITQQQALSIAGSGGNIRVFRIDFSAMIRLPDGSLKRVLIELQKAGKFNAIDRFRTYLGEHYAKPPTPEQGALPILGVYLCGFWLNPALPTVVRVKRQYLDGYTDAVIVLKDKNGHPYQDDFIERLTHDAVMVQIPAIPKDEDVFSSPLKQALQAFNQKTVTADRHYLTFQVDSEEPIPSWIAELLRILTSAASDEPTRKRMAIEDELMTDMARHESMLEAEQQRREEAENREAEERRQKEEERRQKEEERRQKEEVRRQKEEAEVREAEERRLKEAALAENVELRKRLGL